MGILSDHAGATYMYNSIILQWNLSKATSFGTKTIDCIRQVVLLYR